jgi:ribonuclease HI
VAILEAIKLATHKGYDQVVFDSDSQTLVNAIYAQRVGIFEFSSVITSIRSLLNVFLNFKVKFIRRQANLVAQTLARVANYWDCHHIFDITPPCIDLILIN